MLNSQDADRFVDCHPQVVLRALLASNLTSFTEFAFGVHRAISGSVAASCPTRTFWPAPMPMIFVRWSTACGTHNLWATPQ